MTKNKNGTLPYIVSFFLPMIFVLAALACVNIFPFGSKAITASDLGIQYLPITVAAAEKIKHFAFYPISYECGFGVNMFAFCSIFFSSVFNLLFLAVKAAYFQEVYLVIYLLKIGLAGLNTYIFFSGSRIIKCGKSTNIALSVLYALCTHFIIYILLVILLESAMLFPLCLLGAERIVTEKKGGLFVAAYALSVFNSYYYAYMSGVLCFFYTVYFYIIYSGKLEIKSVVRSSLCLIAFAALSVGLCAITILPAMAAVTGGYGDIFNNSPFDPLFVFDIKQLCSALFFIADKPAMDAGLNIYFGIMPLFLTLMLISSRGINAAERIITAVLTLLMLLMLTFKPLYLLMHIGRMPNQFDARFMYGVVFFFLIFSARAIMQHEKINKKLLFIPIVIFLAGLDLALSNEVTSRYLINAFFVVTASIVYAAVFLKSGRYFKRITAAFIILEAFYSAFGGISVIADKTVFPERDIYLSLLNTEKNNTKILKTLDNGFYRSYDINDKSVISQLYGGYNSYSFFSSAANQKVTAFAKNIGVRTPAPHALFHSNAALVTDCVLGVKYILISDKNSADIPNRLFTDIYKEKYTDADTKVLENTAVFPPMFAASKDILDCGKDFADPVSLNGVFTNTQILVNALLDEDIPLYEEYVIDEPIYENCLLAQDKEIKYIRPANLPEGAPYAADETQLCRVKYTFTVPEDGEYCTDTYFRQNSRMFTFEINGKPQSFSYETERTPYDMGYFRKGDIITFEIASAAELSYTAPTILRLDTSALRSAAKKANDAALSDIKEEKGVIRARANFSEEKLIFATIAYDVGLEILIDGKPVEKQQAAEAFTAFTVPEGSHDIEIRYSTPFLKIGSAISAAALLFTFIVFIKRGAALK